MTQTVDVAIIGAGPTGLFAAYYASVRELKTAVFDALPVPGGQLSALYPEKHIFDVPGFKSIYAKDLVENQFAQAQSEWVQWYFSQQIVDVKQLDHQLWSLTSQTGNIYQARAILITAGIGSFSPIKLGLENEQQYESKGLDYFVTSTDDYANKDVVIVGGGDSAVDWANILSENAASVTLVHRRDAFRAHESSVRKMDESTVNVLRSSQVKAISGDRHLEKVSIETKKEDGEIVKAVYNCDRLILALGFKSNLGSILDWELMMNKKRIVVNQNQATSHTGIWAAGDVCATADSADLRLIVLGHGQAVTAMCAIKVFLDPASKMFPGHNSK